MAVGERETVKSRLEPARGDWAVTGGGSGLGVCWSQEAECCCSHDFFFSLLFMTGSHYVILASLELTYLDQAGLRHRRGLSASAS